MTRISSALRFDTRVLFLRTSGQYHLALTRAKGLRVFEFHKVVGLLVLISPQVTTTVALSTLCPVCLCISRSACCCCSGRPNERQICSSTQVTRSGPGNPILKLRSCYWGTSIAYIILGLTPCSWPTKFVEAGLTCGASFYKWGINGEYVPLESYLL